MSAGASSSSNIVFLNDRTKERREDQKSGKISLTLYAAALIAEQQFWSFGFERLTSFENNKVAELKKTDRLTVLGNISMSELTPGIFYEVIYVLKLKPGGCGWEHPVTLILSVPGEAAKSRRVNFYELPKGKWIQVPVGNFKTKHGETGSVSFHLLQHEAHEKKGLVLGSAVVRPKT